jgi:hypothetical protein
MPPRTLPPVSITALLVAALFAPPATATGVPLGPTPGEAHSRPVVLPDGAGGAVVAYQAASGRVGAVRVDANGAPAGSPEFDPSPVPFALESAGPTRAWLGLGGRVLVASDHATANGAALMLFEPDGATAPGYPLGLGMPLLHPAFVTGSQGRTLVVAMGTDATSFWTVRTAELGPTGQLLSSHEYPSQLQFFNSDRLDATTDGAGGLVAVRPYYDGLQTGSKDLCVFRLAADGSTPWGEQPRPIVNQPRDQVDPRIVPDGAGGVFIVWTDPRRSAGSNDIYALRVDSALQRPQGWQFYGQAVCDSPGAQSQPRVVRDAIGGVWVAWVDQRDGVDGDLRYSHMLGNGKLAPGFTTVGAILCAAPGPQRELEMAPDGAGGFFAVWRDERSGSAELYAQHILPSGQRSPAFAANGEPFVVAAGVQDQPSIAALASPAGRVVVAWRDTREGTARIYAAAIADGSSLDTPGPVAGPLALSVASPTRGDIVASVTLSHAGEAEVQLLDVTGRMLARGTLAGPVRGARVTLAPGSSLGAGLYFVRVRHAGDVVTARVSRLR